MNILKCKNEWYYPRLIRHVVIEMYVRELVIIKYIDKDD